MALVAGRVASRLGRAAGRELGRRLDALGRLAGPPLRRAAARLRPRRPGLVVVAATALALLATLAPAPLLRLAAAPLGGSVAKVGRTGSLAQRSELVALDGTRLALLHDRENRRVVPLAAVPQVVRDAVLAAEDRRFWEHEGYDGRAMVRAVLANFRAGGVTQGGSTITQQLAKRNLAGEERSLPRKIKELLYAVALEQRFSKDRLLERYLNEVYFGAGVYGVAAAAEEFFATDVGSLTAEQAALLAGLIRAPAALDPRADPAAATARRNEVLAAMAGSGTLSPEEAARAAAAPLSVVPPPPRELTERFVVEAVVREFLANPAFGATEDDRRRLLLTGGLEVHTTLDPRLQEAARVAARLAPDGLSASLAAVDPRTGAVRALYNGSAAGPASFDVATLGRRQPGSAFKPLVAVAALEAGMPEWQVLAGDGPVEIDYPGGPGPWRVANFGGGSFGLIGLRDAIVNSVNTAVAQLTVAVGTERLVGVAERLGIDPEAALGPPEARGPAIGLGGLARGVSPLELASAYGTLGHGGRRVAPHLIEAVVGPDGQELFRARPEPRPAVDPAVAGLVVDMLQDAVDHGTGWRAHLPGWSPMGKTGTSERGANGWFAGAVPVLAAAVWVGQPSWDEPAGLTGGSDAAPIWQRFMAAAVRPFDPLSFPPPPDRRGPTRALPLPTARLCWDCAA
jgi:penicillin-binding protein 1A